MEEDEKITEEVTTTAADETVAGVEDATAVETAPDGRTVLTERLRRYNPEGVYDTDEDFYNGMGSALDERDKIVESNQRLAQLFMENPQVANFFIDLTEGKGIYSALANNFGDDLMAAIQEGGDAAAEYDAALAERHKAEAKEREMQEEFKKNAGVFKSDFDSWLAEEGYSDEERAEMEQELMRIAEQMSRGNHMDFVKAMHRSRRYDSDIEAARAEGEIRGRNARIAEERTLPKRGDGLPIGPDASRPDEAIEREVKRNEWDWDR